MESINANLLGLRNQLQAELSGKKYDAVRCKSILLEIKLLLAEHGLLIVDPSIPKDTLLLARECLELAVLYATKTRDPTTFETSFTQLRLYYADYAPFLPSSPNFELLTALNLLRLLAQNRLSEFHMTLESQNLSQIVNSKHLTYVLTLEQRLAEGSYHQILSSRQNVPSDEYLYFLEELEKTIRKEIAFCAEKAYKELTIADATAILCTPGKKHTVEIAKSNNWNMQLVEERILFDQWKLMDPTGGAEGGEIPCYEVMEKMLAYARSLETIV